MGGGGCRRKERARAGGQPSWHLSCVLLDLDVDLLIAVPPHETSLEASSKLEPAAEINGRDEGVEGGEERRGERQRAWKVEIRRGGSNRDGGKSRGGDISKD